MERESKSKEGRIGEWEKVVRVPKRVVSVVEVESKYAVKVEGGTGEEPQQEVILEREDHRRFLKEKTNPALDALAASSSTVMGEIKLKRQRLTLREENELRVAEEINNQIKLEREEAQELASLARWRAKGGDANGGGWGTIDVKDEEQVTFDPIDEVETKVDVKVEIKVEDVMAPATTVGGGFKKRKMLGSAASRKK